MPTSYACSAVLASLKKSVPGELVARVSALSFAPAALVAPAGRLGHVLRASLVAHGFVRWRSRAALMSGSSCAESKDLVQFEWVRELCQAGRWFSGTVASPVSGLTHRSSGLTPFGCARPSFHSRPGAAKGSEPLNSNVRQRKYKSQFIVLFSVVLKFAFISWQRPRAGAFSVGAPSSVDSSSNEFLARRQRVCKRDSS